MTTNGQGMKVPLHASTVTEQLMYCILSLCTSKPITETTTISPKDNYKDCTMYRNRLGNFKIIILFWSLKMHIYSNLEIYNMSIPNKINRIRLEKHFFLT